MQIMQKIQILRMLDLCKSTNDVNACITIYVVFFYFFETPSGFFALSTLPPPPHDLCRCMQLGKSTTSFCRFAPCFLLALQFFGVFWGGFRLFWKRMRIPGVSNCLCNLHRLRMALHKGNHLAPQVPQENLTWRYISGRGSAGFAFHQLCKKVIF